MKKTVFCTMLICGSLASVHSAFADAKAMKEADLAWFFSNDDDAKAASDANTINNNDANTATPLVEATSQESSAVSQTSPPVNLGQSASTVKKQSVSKSCSPNIPATAVTHDEIEACLSDQNPPELFLRKMTDYCLTQVKQKKSLIQRDATVAFEIVEDCAMPYIDRQRMGALAIGRPWAKATRQEKIDFIQLFANKVLEDYQHAIASYDNQAVEFLTNTRSTKAIVKVKSVVTGGPSDIPVEYRLVRVNCDDGRCEWRIYDFVVNNISMVRSYHSQFKQIISSVGLSGLIKKLKTNN